MSCPRCLSKLESVSTNCPTCGELLPSLQDPLLGRTLAGKYELYKRLGRGGFGAVYEAHDTSLKEKVAVKTLRPEHTEAPDLVERFRREALAARRLKNPYVVKIYDQGHTEDGVLFLVMELLVGETLQEHLKRVKKLSEEKLV